MMKRFLSVALALTMAASMLAGCSSSGTGSENTAQSGSNTAVSTSNDNQATKAPKYSSCSSATA